MRFTLTFTGKERTDTENMIRSVLKKYGKDKIDKIIEATFGEDYNKETKETEKFHRYSYKELTEEKIAVMSRYANAINSTFVLYIEEVVKFVGDTFKTKSDLGWVANLISPIEVIKAETSKRNYVFGNGFKGRKNNGFGGK